MTSTYFLHYRISRLPPNLDHGARPPALTIAAHVTTTPELSNVSAVPDIDDVDADPAKDDLTVTFSRLLSGTPAVGPGISGHDDAQSPTSRETAVTRTPAFSWP